MLEGFFTVTRVFCQKKSTVLLVLRCCTFIHYTFSKIRAFSKHPHKVQINVTISHCVFDCCNHHFRCDCKYSLKLSLLQDPTDIVSLGSLSDSLVYIFSIGLPKRYLTAKFKLFFNATIASISGWYVRYRLSTSNTAFINFSSTGTMQQDLQVSYMVSWTTAFFICSQVSHSKTLGLKPALRHLSFEIATHCESPKTHSNSKKHTFI